MSILRRLEQQYRAIVGATRPAVPEQPRPDAGERPTLQAGQIDVRDLIARYDHTKHAELADAYFAPLMNNAILRRKPFTDLRESVQILTGLSHAIEGLRLYPQVNVLDFGAGTSWSSRILASLKCRVTALDVSKNALEIGRSIHQEDPLTRDLPIDFRVFDGRSIPAESGTFDRILSFDAFHHVPDQRSMLAEFSRVLRDDGIAAFVEPGPYHSLMPSSQIEMRAFNVIENDIRVDEIWSIARACGFADIKLSFSMPRQELVPLDDFNRFIETRTVPDDVVFSRGNLEVHRNRRVFFLYKSASREADSRFIEGLNYRLQLVDVTPVDADSVRLTLVVENTGSATWLPSGFEPGNVNVGMHLKAADGTLLDNDFGRLPISRDRVVQGQKRDIVEVLRLPDAGDFNLELDLVAESIIWFEIVGGSPLTLSFRGRKYVDAAR
ncbi:MAG: class I SAM-dependent methyltransferase [Reyranella sp.]|uniref:class I SAM-dependent methyltransferase n=1 Tax=Reyranella sp. TaxID=1929291 RepID=UPI003D10494B